MTSEAIEKIVQETRIKFGLWPDVEPALWDLASRVLEEAAHLIDVPHATNHDHLLAESIRSLSGVAQEEKP